MITDKQLLELQRDYEKLKAENTELKKKKKFGLVWEEQSSEKDIDDKEHYPFLSLKGGDFGFDNGDARKNILIEGDNYHALEILQYTHKGAVDVIYIDPPYNTGKKKEFRYNDHWVDAEDGYRHSKWLTFMDKRLRLAKELLKKEGVIFISIDDNEQARLKLLCDDVFGADRFVGLCPRIVKKGGKSSGNFEKNHDYVLIYFKSEKSALLNLPHDDKGFKFKDDFFDERGFYKLNQTLDYDSIQYSRSLDYVITLDGKEIIPGGSSCEEMLQRQQENPEKDWCWRWSEPLFHFGYKNDFIVVKNGKNKKPRIYTKTYQNATISKDDNGEYFVEILPRKKPMASIEFMENIYSNDNAKKDLKKIFGKDSTVFDYSKPVELISQLLRYSTQGDAIILDFFAGSGTTGHAVMDLALKERERERERERAVDEEASRVTYNPQFILVTNNENNICEEVCYERLKRANEKYGYGSNLEYLKTELLEYDPERHCDLDIRAFMVEKITEIIKVREACFKIEPITNYLQKFAKDEKSVYVLHNVYDMKPQDYKDAVEILSTDSNDKINIYVLAMSNHAHYAQKLSKCGKNITFEPLPESFLKLLRKIDTNIRKTK